MHFIRDDVKLAQLVRARDCQSQGRQFDSGKNSKKNRELFCFLKEKVRFGALTGSCSQGPTLVFWEQVELDK